MRTIQIEVPEDCNECEFFIIDEDCMIFECRTKQDKPCEQCLSATVKKEKCKFDFDGIKYQTKCGIETVLVSHVFKYCPFCGKEIEI